jgi:hypothetical protein
MLESKSPLKAEDEETAKIRNQETIVEKKGAKPSLFSCFKKKQQVVRDQS